MTILYGPQGPDADVVDPIAAGAANVPKLINSLINYYANNLSSQYNNYLNWPNAYSLLTNKQQSESPTAPNQISATQNLTNDQISNDYRNSLEYGLNAVSSNDGLFSFGEESDKYDNNTVYGSVEASSYTLPDGTTWSIGINSSGVIYWNNPGYDLPPGVASFDGTYSQDSFRQDLKKLWGNLDYNMSQYAELDSATIAYMFDNFHLNFASNPTAGDLQYYFQASSIRYFSASAISGMAPSGFSNLLLYYKDQYLGALKSFPVLAQGLNPAAFYNVMWQRQTTIQLRNAAGVSADDPFAPGVLGNLTNVENTIYIGWLISFLKIAHQSTMTDAAFSALNTDGQLKMFNSYYAFISTTSIPNITNSTLSLVNGATFLLLTLAQMQALTPTQISHISPDQFAQLGKALAKLTPFQLCKLTNSQVPAITREQWHALSPIQFLAVAGGVTGAKIWFPDLTEAQVAAITLDILDILTVGQLTTMTGPQVAALTFQQLLSLTPAQIGALSQFAIDFNPMAVAGLSSDQYNALGPNPTFASGAMPVFLMSKQQMATIPVGTLVQLPNNVIAALTTDQLKGLTRIQVLSLRTDQYEALSTSQQAALICVPILLMTSFQISQLSTTDIAGVDPNIIGALTAGNLLAFTPQQVKSLLASQIADLSSWVLNTLGMAFIAEMTSSQLQQIPTTTLAALDPLLAQKIRATYATLLTPAQITSLTNNTLASISTLTNPPSLRTIYTSATGIRYLIGWVGAEQRTSPFNFIRTYFKNYESTVQNSRSAQQGMRLIGSALAFNAVFQDLYQISQETGPGKSQALAALVFQALQFLASLLQVPVGIMVAIYDNYVKGGDTPMDTFLKKVGLGSFIKDVANLDHDLAGADPVAIAADNAAVASDETAARQILGIESIYGEIIPDSGFGSIRLRANLANFGYNGVSAYTFEDTPAAQVDNWKLLWPNSEPSIQALRENSTGIITGLFGMTAGALQLAVGAETGQPLTIALGLLNLLTSLAGFIGDGIEVLFGASAELANVASKIIGYGTFFGILGADAIGIGGAALNYEKSQTKGNLVGLIGTIVADAAQFALIVWAMAAGGFPGVVLGVIAALIPSFASIGQAIDIVDKWSTYDSQGRFVDGDIICKYFHTIAALQATPIINFASFISTPILMDELYSEMSAPGVLATALTQDFAYGLTLSAPSSDISKEMGEIASTSALASPVTDILSLTLQNVDVSTYYLSAKQSYDAYISKVDVKLASYSPGIDQLTPQQADGSYGTLTETLTDSGTGTKVVQVTNTIANSTLFVDATGATEKMQFLLDSANITIHGGSGGNVYFVQASIRGQATIVGGSSNKDAVQIVQDNTALSTDTINMDMYSNVCVLAALGFKQNTVTGTKSGQVYTYGASIDTVSLTGGKGIVEVGGRGTTLLMAGGNNLANVILGYYSGTVSNLASYGIGTYDGGATVAASTDNSIGFSGTNTINFGGSTEALKIDITNSTQTSSVSTTTGSFADAGTFTNFEGIVGSNLGDNIHVNNSTGVQQLQLGFGNNVVNIDSTSGLTVTSGAESDMILVSGNSSVTINKIANSEGELNLDIEGTSSVQGFLGGNQDHVDASMDSAGTVTANNSPTLIDFNTGVGTHSIILGGATAVVTMDAQYSNDNTLVQGAKGVSTLLQLGRVQSKELVQSLDGGKTISFLSTDGSNQRLDYTFGAGDTGQQTLIQSVPSGTVIADELQLSLIVQAMASISTTSVTINGQITTGYSLADLNTYATDPTHSVQHAMG